MKKRVRFLLRSLPLAALLPIVSSCDSPSTTDKNSVSEPDTYSLTGTLSRDEELEGVRLHSIAISDGRRVSYSSSTESLSARPKTSILWLKALVDETGFRAAMKFAPDSNRIPSTLMSSREALKEVGYLYKRAELTFHTGPAPNARCGYWEDSLGNRYRSPGIAAAADPTEGTRVQTQFRIVLDQPFAADEPPCSEFPVIAEVFE